MALRMSVACSMTDDKVVIIYIATNIIAVYVSETTRSRIHLHLRPHASRKKPDTGSCLRNVCSIAARQP